ncbi:MAG: hypothetical protein WCN95_06725, partial [bacterium]
RAQADRLINAYLAYENVSTLVTTAYPENEAQVRPLTRLKDDPEQQKVAWGRAVQKANGKKVSASIVSKVVSELLGNTEEAPVINDTSITFAVKYGKALRKEAARLNIDKMAIGDVTDLKRCVLDIQAVMSRFIGKIDARLLSQVRKAA